MKKLCVFTRPFCNRFMNEYTVVCAGEWDVKFLSDFKYRDDLQFVSRLYRHLKKANTVQDAKDIPYDEVIARCRFLRFLDSALARKLINAAWCAIDEIFQKNKFDAYIGTPMDNYILDLVD